MNSSGLTKMNFDYDKMKLTQVYGNEKPGEHQLDCPQLRKVFGEPFRIGTNYPDRPYAYNSVVMSIDGKIAFDDVPQGPMIATKNRYGSEDALIDWWMLNLLRASADAIIFGANTLVKEPTATGHVYDDHLEQLRITSGQNAVPLNIIPTLDGSDIPSEHLEFRSAEIPVLFYTVSAAVKTLKTCFPDLIVVGPIVSTAKLLDSYPKILPGQKVAVLCGNGNLPDPRILMGYLKRIGVDRLLVESPMLTHLFLQEGLMDELFINTSGLYVGGSSMSIGKNGKPFLSDVHPHTKMISLHVHSPHFLFTRYALMKEGHHDGYSEENRL